MIVVVACIHFLPDSGFVVPHFRILRTTCSPPESHLNRQDAKNFLKPTIESDEADNEGDS
jgi:hypothetical protein